MIECNDNIIRMWIEAISEPRHPRAIELGSHTNQSGLREHIHATGQFAVRPIGNGTIRKHRIKEGKLVERIKPTSRKPCISPIPSFSTQIKKWTSQHQDGWFRRRATVDLHCTGYRRKQVNTRQEIRYPYHRQTTDIQTQRSRLLNLLPPY
jgi:hypothetical protein